MNRAAKTVILTAMVCTALTLGACATDGYYTTYTSYGGPSGGPVAYTSSYAYPYATPNYYASSNIYLASYRTPVYQTVGFTPVNTYYYGGGYATYRSASFRGHPRYRARYYYRGMPYYNRFYYPRSSHARFRAHNRAYRSYHHRASYRSYRGHRGHYRVRGGHHRSRR
ncbi:hypothetical protein BTJ40_21095 [Microbulbifer sp. A4B17]|uniref:hypothetical protein n=1 Tax=Microbulbifer sp. A4B17 TaxID=359370 RepID=UPI000D52C3A8|nr:hypothetical protein [Microbulbifer sp. A4B17]AWF83108.1 hypothetical protein BTJ40_21095 [Microbulbifer sp. A4B17]